MIRKYYLKCNNLHFKLCQPGFIGQNGARYFPFHQVRAQHHNCTPTYFNTTLEAKMFKVKYMLQLLTNDYTWKLTAVTLSLAAGMH